MQVDRIFYPVKTLGYGIRIGIWTIGCPRRCFNCSNPELQNTDAARDISIDDIVSVVRKYADKIDGVTITGGDPFFQPSELRILTEKLDTLGIDDILIYTGYTLEEIKNSSELSPVLKYTGVLIDGEYIDAMNDNLGIRGSSNQKIHILKDNLIGRYVGADCCERKSSIINSGGKVMAVGIPIKAR